MNSLRRLRIAVATKGRQGLEDSVSEVFGRANTFTIVDVEGEAIRRVEVIENPAVTYKYGAGPIVVKTLIDHGVDVVVAASVGPGASGLLEQHNLRTVLVEPGTRVRDSIGRVLSECRAS